MCSCPQRAPSRQNMAYLRRLVFKRNNHIQKRGSLLACLLWKWESAYSRMTAHRGNHAGLGGFQQSCLFGGFRQSFRVGWVFDNIILSGTILY
mmetsp:Transcript_41498/g.99948  ORF Transcript_41498/g.99948 Transcript_41498/m.99948 type:complete len:93 (+) Transcript_41498:448-726(+)